MRRSVAGFVVLSVISLAIGGCGDSKSVEAKVVSQSDEVKQTKEVETKKSTSKVETNIKRESANLSGFYRVFNDSASIAPKGNKPMMIVFGQPADPYTQKLQKDVEEKKGLADKIKSTVTPIYIDATAHKRHKFYHSGQMMDVDTKTLVSIYHIDSTPTIIFTDMNGSSIFIVPGYMPPKQFEVTLDFLKEGVWRGKDRKNGEVYQALKDYYISHGVKVGGAK